MTTDSLRPPRAALAALVALGVAGLLAARLAERSWGSVVAYTAPYSLPEAEPGSAPRIAERVVLVLVDGLRLDASRAMPTLNLLRERGADFASSAGAPSYSRPGRASLGSGAWAELHGATTNFHSRALGVDNLFRRAAVHGRSCLVAGSLWGSLFGPDLQRAGCVLREPTAKDEPGRYFELEPGLRAFGGEALRLVAESRAELNVVDLIVTDYAAHEFGGRSDEYRRAVARSDEQLAWLVERLDLSSTTLVVTADHGHLDEGGHGGPEPEVLQTPLVLVGCGVRAGVRSEARQVDVAPSIAALLGLEVPGSAQGRVLVEALDLQPGRRLDLLGLQWRQQRALGASLLAFLERRPEARGAHAEPPADEAALMASLSALDARLDAKRLARLEAERRARLPLALAVVLVPLPFLLHALRRARWTHLRAVLAGALVYGLAFRVLVWGRGVRLALSAINHEQDVGPYFLRIALLAALAFLASLAVAALSARSHARTLAGLALALGSLLVYLLACAVALVHWRQGMFMEWQRADLGQGFLGFVNLVQIEALSLTAVLVCLPAFWLGQRALRKA